MSSDVILSVENVSKLYRLGTVGTGTFGGDVQRFWKTKVLGQEDPFLKIGQTNDRTSKEKADFVWALQDINFEVKRGEVLGIIGKNGAGKSTLLKLLSRITAPTTGRIRSAGRMASLLEVGTGFHPELTGRENIFLNGAILGMTKREIQSKFDEIVDFSGCELYIDTPVKRYSSGMTVRLGFAVAAFLDPEILVVDEVLAVGDAEFQKKAIGKMKEVSAGGGRTVLFVSHNMASINELCSRVIVLENGKGKFEGDVDKGLAIYMQQGSLLEYYNNSLSLGLPDFESINLDAKELERGTLKLELKYKTPFQLDAIHPGVVVKNSFGIPIFGTNTRMHPMKSDSKPPNEGVITLSIENAPLLSGEYLMSVFLGDSNQDYQSYEDVLGFSFITKSVDSSKSPSTRVIGSIDIKGANWNIE